MFCRQQTSSAASLRCLQNTSSGDPEGKTYGFTRRHPRVAATYVIDPGGQLHIKAATFFRTHVRLTPGVNRTYVRKNSRAAELLAAE